MSDTVLLVVFLATLIAIAAWPGEREPRHPCSGIMMGSAAQLLDCARGPLP